MFSRLREQWGNWLISQIRAEVAEEIACAIERQACRPGEHCASAYCAQARADAVLARAAAAGPLTVDVASTACTARAAG